MNIYRTVVVFCVALALLWGAPGCGRKVPPTGSAEWHAGLEKGRVYIETQTVPGTALKLGSATGLIDAPIEVMWEVFKDADSFSQFLYHVKESRELPPRGELRVIEFVIEPPTEAQLIFKDIHFKAEISETINREANIWRGDYQATEGNIERVYGAWQLEAYAGNKTLVTFSSFNDFGYPESLDWAVNIYTAQFLDHWSEDLRERVEDPAVRFDLEQRAAARAGRDPRELAPTVRGLEDFIR